MIGRAQLARAALFQALFVARGAGTDAVRRIAEDGIALLAGYPVRDLRALVVEAMEPVLKPLLYAEPLALVQRHRERGEPVYIVSAALQEIVDALVAELDFDGGIGSLGEVEDGVFTGRVLRVCHHEAKAEAVDELAARDGVDLDESTAYSDSASDLPFLEAVGYPVAVNPDAALRQVALARGWPVLAFDELLHPAPRRRVAPAVVGLPFVLGAGMALWAAARRRAA